MTYMYKILDTVLFQPLKNDCVRKPLSINSISCHILYSNTTVFQKDLNKLIFLAIELYDSQFKLCITNFKLDVNNSIIPSTHETIMNFLHGMAFSTNYFDLI